MGSLIIALPKADEAGRISLLLKKQGIHSDAVCTTASEVLQNARRIDSGVIVCSMRLPDMSSTELYEYLPDYYDMVIISASSSDSPDGIIRLCNPFKISNLVSTIEMLNAQQERRLRKKNDFKPKRNTAERQLIDRAKQVLMERNDMTEPEAYRYIQKSSMDSGTNLAETAEMILMLSDIR